MANIEHIQQQVKDLSGHVTRSRIVSTSLAKEFGKMSNAYHCLKDLMEQQQLINTQLKLRLDEQEEHFLNLTPLINQLISENELYKNQEEARKKHLDALRNVIAQQHITLDQHIEAIEIPPIPMMEDFPDDFFEPFAAE